MSVPNENRRNDYVGNGALSVYDYSFRIMHKSHLKVVVYDPSTKVHTPLAEGTNYDVSGVGETDGGSITLLGSYANLTTGHLLSILLNPPLTQTSDIRNDDSYYQDAQEDDHDRRVYQVLRLSEAVDRSFKIPESEAGTAVATTWPRAEERAGKFAAFDGSGNPKVEPGVNLAPLDAQYVVMSLGSLPNARVLESVANGISVVDGGPGGTVTLTLPQDLHTAATPQFAEVRLGGANRILTADADDQLAIKRGTNPQALNIYNTTSGINHEFLLLGWQSNVAYLQSTNIGGTPRDLYVGTAGAASVYLRTGGTNRVQMDPSGHLLWVTDNAGDVGGAANRPRDVRVGRDLYVGGLTRVPSGSAIRTGASGDTFFLDLGDVSFRDGDGSASGANVVVYGTVSVGNTDVVLARDAAAVLALKNSTTAQEFRVYGTTTGPVYLRLFGTGTEGGINTVGGSLRIDAAAGAVILGGTVHVHSGSNNGIDLGAATAKWRNIHWGTQAIGPAGSAAAPSIALGGEQTGPYLVGAGTLGLALAGTQRFTFAAGSLTIHGGGTALTLQGTGSTINVGGAVLVEEGNDILSQRRSTNPQTFRLYNTYTSAANHERLDITWDTNVASIRTATVGGVARELALGCNGVNLFGIEPLTPSFYPIGVGYDLGKSANKFRALHLSQMVAIGTNPAAAGAVRLANNVTVSGRNAANSADINLLRLDTADVVVLGDTSGVKVQVGNSGSAQLGFFGATPVSRPTYGAPTGTATRTTFATGSVTLAQLAERVKAMIDDFRLYGLFA